MNPVQVIRLRGDVRGEEATENIKKQIHFKTCQKLKLPSYFPLKNHQRTTQEKYQINHCIMKLALNLKKSKLK